MEALEVTGIPGSAKLLKSLIETKSPQVAHGIEYLRNRFGNTRYENASTASTASTVGNDWVNANLLSGNTFNSSSNASTASTVGNASNINRTALSLVPRNITKGELPYTETEINEFFTSDGHLKPGLEILWGENRNTVNTGAHGDFYMSTDSPTDVLKKYLSLSDPNNSNGSLQQLRKIRADNPRGRSGILIKTHSGDTSIDSSPLAYSIATGLGKRFKPAVPDSGGEFVVSNGFGYNNFFKRGYNTEADRARTLFKNHPNAEAKLLTDREGNMYAFELTDEAGTFQIPLNSNSEVQDIINRRIEAFNKHYGTNYPFVKPFRPNSKWNLGYRYYLPNISGIAYKQGGKMERGLLTRF